MTFQFSNWCKTRSTLEERVLDSVNDLCNLTSQLASLANIADRYALLSIREQCSTAHADIDESRRQLVAHRAEHGC
jgi:hypothetical protein